jgi:hypothetical protein
VRQFEITPKAFANFSPGFEHRENPGNKQKYASTLKGFVLRGTLSGLVAFLNDDPRVLAALEPWAGVSERL